MNHLIIGMGQIGTAVAGIFSEAKTFDLGDDPVKGDIDVLHICFPYSDSFVIDVSDYREKYNAKHIIIYSTVKIGTTKQITNAVHSPVEGKHPDLELSIRHMKRWIGCNDIDQAAFYRRLFWERGIEANVVFMSDWTEFLKLRSTAKYGINLAWTDYEDRVSSELGMPFHLITYFDQDYNRLYKNLGLNWAQRYILDPPKGKIGGHCVVPNAEILDEQFPDDMLKIIRRMKS